MINPTTQVFMYGARPVAEIITPEMAVLHKDWTYWSERLGGEHTIKAGFEFDWDSIGRWKVIFYWWLKDRAKAAALAHDDLYKHALFAGRRITRKEADLVFWDAMVEEMRRTREYKRLSGWRLLRAETADTIRRQVIYRGVRVGGWHAWNKHRAAELAA